MAMASKDEAATRWLGSFYNRLDNWPQRPAAQQEGTFFITSQAKLWRVRRRHRGGPSSDGSLFHDPHSCQLQFAAVDSPCRMLTVRLCPDCISIAVAQSRLSISYDLLRALPFAELASGHRIFNCNTRTRTALSFRVVLI